MKTLLKAKKLTCKEPEPVNGLVMLFRLSVDVDKE